MKDMDRYQRHMKISELSAYTETPAATIRFYVREGLLPLPMKTGKTMAYYTEVHLERLQAIRRLKSQGLDLKGIRDAIENGNQTPLMPRVEGMHTRTREAIVTAAVELFREKGYDATSILDIATRARVGKGTFYNCFKCKEELFFECAENVFYDIAKDVPLVRDEIDGLKRLWNRTVSWTRSTRHMFDMLNLTRGASLKENPSYKAKLDHIMYNLIEPIKTDVETAIAQGHLRPMNSTLVAYLLLGALEYGLYYVIDRTANAEEVATKGWEIVFGGLGLRSEDAHTEDPE
jgi:AcrR family transcriptional regulator